MFKQVCFIASVQAACECLGSSDADVTAQVAVLEYPEKYGEVCSNDAEQDWCQEGGVDFGKKYCETEWCYVAADSTCEDGEVDEEFEGSDAEGVKFSYAVCASGDESSGEESSGALMLMASAAALMANFVNYV